jgi:prepilin-type N-terminal cleavage/methylation domain-containing protein
MVTRAPRVLRRGFSLVEMLIALTISAALLAVSLQALDALFKSYQGTSETASTHVVSRLIMHRAMTMIRTGSDFAPYPADVLDADDNPVISDFVEFVSRDDGQVRVITRLERRTQDVYTVGNRQYHLRGPGSLWIVTFTQTGADVVISEQPLLDAVEDLTFTLEYDIGPRLRRATMDLRVAAGGDTYYESAEAQDGAAKVRDTLAFLDNEGQSIRLVASTSPRRLE